MNPGSRVPATAYGDVIGSPHVEMYGCFALDTDDHSEMVGHDQTLPADRDGPGRSRDAAACSDVIGSPRVDPGGRAVCNAYLDLFN